MTIEQLAENYIVDNKHCQCLLPIDIRKVIRAIHFISKYNKVRPDTIGNFVDGNDWFSDRSNARQELALYLASQYNLLG